MSRRRKVCQWPDKQRHASRGEALQAIAAMYAHGRGNPDLQAYQCVGHWHVGHSVVHFRRRIRAALRGTPRTRRTR